MVDQTAEEADALGQGTSTVGQRSAQAEQWDYGGNPLARLWTEGQLSGTEGPSAAQLQPGLFKEVEPARANPAPLGLAGFALTTFLLSIINLGTRGVMTPNIVVGSSFAYGGLVQLCAGMWYVWTSRYLTVGPRELTRRIFSREMGFGNTFAAWALSSYGGFWISLAITFTPGGFGVAKAYGGEDGAFYTALAFYLYGWFIFTVLVNIATLRSTLIFFLLIFTVWMAFFFLATGYLDNSGGPNAKPRQELIIVGGGWGIIASFLAWWIMIAGILNKGNRYGSKFVRGIFWSAG